VGPPRTATTLQFQALCVALFLRVRARCSPAELDGVKCKYVGGAIRKIENISSYTELYPYTVLKTHTLDAISKLSKSDFTVATTSKVWQKYLGKSGVKVGVLSEPGELVNSSHEILIRSYVLKYSKLFELSISDTEELIQYLMHWDVLRVCCGVQMSARWRRNLESGTESRASANIKLCNKYADIGLIENTFIGLNLTAQIIEKEAVAIMARPSNKDEKLDGSYCKNYRDFVKKKHSGMNIKMTDSFQKKRKKFSNG